MTLRYITGSTIVTTNGVDALVAATGDTIIVAADAVVASTGPSTAGNAIFAAATTNDVDIYVQGLVFSTGNAIDLTGISGNEVTVAETGTVLSELGNAISVNGEDAYIDIRGTVQSMDGGLGGVASFALYSSITNTGLIQCSSTFGSAVYTDSPYGTDLVNLGTISSIGPGGYGIYFLGGGYDTVWNSGTVTGNIYLGNGDDLYQGPGRVSGLIIGDSGDDTVIGGGFDDVISDVSGGNWLAGGDGADLITIGDIATDGAADRVFGGVIGGADTSTNDTLQVEASSPSSGVNVFLNGGYVTTATNQLLAVMTGIENATGTNQLDSLIGSNGANVLNGRDGADWLVGNGGADTFVFTFSNEADSDQIRDFRRSEGDRIDLSLIDANTATLAEDSFLFSTTRTSNLGGQAVVTNYGTSAVVNLYTNADNVADGTFIVVYGEAGVTSLTAADFFL